VQVRFSVIWAEGIQRTIIDTGAGTASEGCAERYQPPSASEQPPPTLT
jgi:hypothetical protein